MRVAGGKAGGRSGKGLSRARESSQLSSCYLLEYPIQIKMKKYKNNVIVLQNSRGAAVTCLNMLLKYKITL